MMKYISKMLLIVGLLGTGAILGMEGSLNEIFISNKNKKLEGFYYFKSDKNNLKRVELLDQKGNPLSPKIEHDVSNTIKLMKSKAQQPLFDITNVQTFDDLRKLVDKSKILYEDGKYSPYRFTGSWGSPLYDLNEQVKKDIEVDISRDDPYPKPEIQLPLSQVIKKHPYLTSVGLFTVAAVTLAYGIYKTLKSAEKRRINRVLTKHDLNIDQFNAVQKDMMAAATRAAHRVPTYMSKLKALFATDQLASTNVDEQTMLKILASLYYKKNATDEDVALLKEVITPVIAPEVMKEGLATESFGS